MQTNIQVEARPRTRKWHIQTINQSSKQCKSVENVNADKIMPSEQRKRENTAQTQVIGQNG